MTLFESNLAALERRSPDTAAVLRRTAADPAFRVVTSVSGDPVVERGGRVLDSRRDPAGAADRVASSVGIGRVVVAGLGGGYFAEALLRRGIDVAAIVDASPAAVLAALRARPLESLLSRVLLIVLDEGSPDPIALASLRASADAIVPHAAAVADSACLRTIVDRWQEIRVADRVPRVLVVGPVYGGSLEIARSTARAFVSLGTEARLFDASVYADGYHHLGRLPLAQSVRQSLQTELASVLGQAVVQLSLDWRPDLVVALAQAPLDQAALDSLRRSGVTTAFWFVENERVLTYWKQIAGHYDWIYAIQDGGFLDRLSQAGCARPRYLPTACDPERHRPVTLTDDERRRFESDVSFAGAPYLNRRRMFPALMDFDLKIWGAGWADPQLARAVVEGGRAFGLDEMVRIFAASKINLNLHSSEHVAGLDPTPDFVNPRTFELAACEAFQLVDVRDPLPALFDDSEMVTFASLAELREKIAFYLADEDERMAVARRARRRAIADHTYERRVMRMLRDCVRADLVAACSTTPAESLLQAIGRLEQESPVLTRDEALLRVLDEVDKGTAV